MFFFSSQIQVRSSFMAFRKLSKKYAFPPFGSSIESIGLTITYGYKESFGDSIWRLIGRYCSSKLKKLSVNDLTDGKVYIDLENLHPGTKHLEELKLVFCHLSGTK